MGFDSIGSTWLWAGFAALVAVMLVIDLGVFHRRAHVVSIREAAVWTVVWVLVSLGFNAFILWRLGWNSAEEFLTGYAIEKALAVDNLFVIYVLFATLAIPREHQHRILFWGILGAIVMRTAMVFTGAALLSRFHILIFVFGAFLVFTGVKMLRRHGEEPRVEDSRLLRVIKRVLPMTDKIESGRMFVKVDGAWRATPLFVALLCIEASDAVFAVDSIFAIFAITLDPFIVLTSNIFAMLGLRSLYFVLAGAATRFVYIQPGLALVLIFVGVKMAIADWFKIPVMASLAVVAALIGGSIALSLWRTRARDEPAFT